MKKHLLFLFAALLPLLASAQTKVEIDGIWYNLITKGEVAEVTSGGTKYSGSINIPSTVTHEGKEYSVTSIGDKAFYECSNLTAITLPEGLTSIRNGAFSFCDRLTTITLPEGLTSIGGSSFLSCSSLKAITIPKSVTSIENNAFSGCSSLMIVINYSELYILRGSTNYGGVGYYANRVINIDKVIDGYAFKTIDGVHYMTGYIGEDTELTLPESYQGENYNIISYAFNRCYNLTAITIPEGVTSIGTQAFYYCSSLESITLPEGMTSIGESTFRYCSSLKSITLPEGVTSIGKYAFQFCSSLTAITIPKGVTSIGNYAFYDCSNLTTIVLPKKLGYIGLQAFAYCPELLNVYCYAEKVPSTKTDAFEGSYPEYITLHVPTSALNAYKTTEPWSSFGKFETFEVTVENITLDQSTATLTEGEDLTLTATVIPDDATDISISWSSSNSSVATVDNTGKVTAVAPGTATITAMANDGSGVSASCEVTVNELILGKCAIPVISYADGQVVITCDTEDVKIKSITTENCAGEREEVVFNVIPTYTITAYATKAKYEDSDIATLILCWIPCKEEHKDDNGIITIPSKPVLIQIQDGNITISGLNNTTAVAAFDTAGTLLAAGTATDGTAILSTGLEAGSIAIVKIGDYSVKVVIK